MISQTIFFFVLTLNQIEYINKIVEMEAWIIKLLAMIIMFSLIMITGNIPLRSKSFKSNPKVLALSSAFAGGLFLAVGILHLLPEASEHFDDYYKVQNEPADGKGDSGNDDEDHFPWSYFITVCSFALILFIEKIATDHTHSHDDHSHSMIKQSILKRQSHLVENVNIDSHLEHEGEDDEEFEENIIREGLNKKKQFASKLSMIQKDGKTNLAPYILQVAIGIHAVFEGLAIGIEQQTVKCLSITIAVVCHKWAEGLTLGLAFKKANVDLKMSTIMIAIQAVMNPIGIGIGWALSDQGNLVTGIFMSISAGTFVYIATLEVLVEEFNVKRYKIVKYIFFLIAIGFVSSLWFIEQATGG
ncbi:hypothetical protein ABPG72_018645 [Tetrahymena utriculariae]